MRAGLVRSAGKWKWSSHRHYAYGERNDIITDAPEYLALGATAPARRMAYLHLFARALTAGLRVRRRDFVDAPFVGDERWVAARFVACGLSPPQGAGLGPSVY